MMLELFIQSFVIYFVVVDPFGNAPIFLSLTQSQNQKEKIQTSIEGVLIATIILIVFSLIGNLILTYLNISLPAFRIAGGIILFIILLDLLMIYLNIFFFSLDAPTLLEPPLYGRRSA